MISVSTFPGYAKPLRSPFIPWAAESPHRLLSLQIPSTNGEVDRAQKTAGGRRQQVDGRGEQPEEAAGEGRRGDDDIPEKVVETEHSRLLIFWGEVHDQRLARRFAELLEPPCL